MTFEIGDKVRVKERAKGIMYPIETVTAVFKTYVNVITTDLHPSFVNEEKFEKVK